MWIPLLMLLLLLATPISCRAEIRQEHGNALPDFPAHLGIPLRFDHSQAPLQCQSPVRPAVAAGQSPSACAAPAQAPRADADALKSALEQLLVHVALRDPAATALTTAFLRQIRLLIPVNCRGNRIAVTPRFHEQTVWRRGA